MSSIANHKMCRMNMQEILFVLSFGDYISFMVVWSAQG